MTIPAVICLLLLIMSVFTKTWFSFFLMLVYVSFGMLAIVDPGISGGSSILVVSVAALVFVGKTFAQKDGFAEAWRLVKDPRKMGLLTLFLVIALIGAAILPGLFTGKIYIYPLRARSSLATGHYGLLTVEPGTQNFTQSAYLFLSCLTALCVAVNMRRKEFAKLFLDAILIGGWVLIATGAVDIVFSIAGIGGLLEGFKNASFNLIDSAYISGSRRVVGLMPEASTFAFVSTQFAALLFFLRPMYPAKVREYTVPLTAAGCALMGALTLSSTGIVILGVLAAVYLVDLGLRMSKGAGQASRALTEAGLAIAGIVIVIGLVLLSTPDFADAFLGTFEKLTVGKQYSLSYKERSSWNNAALNAFFDSYGAGIGLGSVRVSNFFIGIAACTGLLGTLSFLAFNVWIFVFPAPADDEMSRQALHGLRSALVPALAGLATSVTGTDFGPLVALIYGAIVGLRVPHNSFSTIDWLNVRSRSATGASSRSRSAGRSRGRAASH